MTIIPNQHLIVSRQSCAMFNCGVFTRDTHLCARDSSRQRSGARRRHGQSDGSRDASSRLTTGGRSVAVRHTRCPTQRASERAVFQSSRPIGSETTAAADDALSRIDRVAAEWRARFRANPRMSSAAARARETGSDDARAWTTETGDRFSITRAGSIGGATRLAFDAETPYRIHWWY